jgi:hypothetical protein
LHTADWTPWTTGSEADRWAALFEQALAQRVHPGISPEEERLLRPLALLALVTQRLPAAALLTPALVLCDGEEGDPVRAAARRLAGETVRLTVRALEVHARDIGYAPGEWIAAGVVQAELSASDVDGPAAVATFLEDAARSIAAALVATENDVMAVAEHLSSAIGAGLALYALIIDAAAW